MTSIATLSAVAFVAIAAIYIAVKVVKLAVKLALIGGAVALIYFYVFPQIERLL